ncbi:MAG: hypothetical protein H7263_07795, partial [Candidatus Sericytochromatia bacterium]|nr:hypothetical protein [Candidatus Sericytochromatia bacterium]
MFKNYSLCYGFYGLSLGLSLPLLVYFLNNNIGYSGTFSYKNINPLLIFFIVSFHLLLTLILFLIGKKYQKIIDSNNKLKIINQENIEFHQDTKSLNTSNLFAFIEGNNDSIWSFDQDYKLLMFNSKFKKSYKLVFEKDPEIGVDLKDFLYVPQYRVWANLFKRALDGEKFIEEVNLSINGKDIYTELTFNPVVVKDKVVSVITHSRNISQQKKIEL